MKWTILPSDCPVRLFDFLERKQIPKPLWRKMTQHSFLYYQGHKRSLSDYLVPGETLDLSEYFPSFQKNSHHSLDKIYENEHLLIVNKPAGLLTHPASTSLAEISLNDLVLDYFYSSNLLLLPQPVTRLDRNTSGLVLYAKSNRVQNYFQSSGKLSKHYLTMVQKNFPQTALTLSGPIQRAAHSIIEREIGPQGQTAVTQITLKAGNHSFSLLECQLLTGRTHQIRVHLSSLGFPVIGDDLYGGEKNDFLSKGHALHAWKLSCTEENEFFPAFSVQSPLPDYVKKEFPYFPLEYAIMN